MGEIKKKQVKVIKKQFWNEGNVRAKQWNLLKGRSPVLAFAYLQ